MASTCCAIAAAGVKRSRSARFSKATRTSVRLRSRAPSPQRAVALSEMPVCELEGTRDATTSIVRLPSQLQLAQLVDEAPTGDAWLHEQKFDGYRVLAELDGRKVRLLSRRFKDWTAQFPTVVDAVSALPVRSVLLDGEVAVLMPDGRTSFQALQNAIGGRAANIVYFVFDLLAVDGEDLTKLPLVERKRRLAKLVGTSHG